MKIEKITGIPITRTNLINAGYKETKKDNLVFYTLNDFTIVYTHGLWCPCNYTNEPFIGNTYLKTMEDIEYIKKHSQLK